MAPSTTVEQAPKERAKKASQNVAQTLKNSFTTMFNVSQSKSTRANSYLATIIASLMFLQLALSLMGIGILGAVNTFTYRQAAAKEIVMVRQDVVRKEKFLETTYNNLLNLELPYKPFETYDQCLVRGINVVDAHFSGIPFTENPGILVGSVDWVEGACSKQQFTPQPYTKQPKYPKLHYLHELALDLKYKIKTQAATTWQQVNKWYTRNISKKPVKQHPDKAPEEDEDGLMMPPHFHIMDLPGSPSRLVFQAPSPDYMARQDAYSKEALEDAKNLLAHYTSWLVFFLKALRFIHAVQLVTYPAHIILILASLAFGLDFMNQDDEEICSLGRTVADRTHVVMFSLLQMSMFTINIYLLVTRYDISESTAISSFLLGLLTLIAFTVPSRYLNVYTLVISVLCLAFLVINAPRKEHKSPTPSLPNTPPEARSPHDEEAQAGNWQFVDDKATGNANNGQPAPASASQSRRSSSDSSFQEDLAKAVKDHREAKASSSRPATPQTPNSSSEEGLSPPPKIIDEFQEVDLQSEISSTASEWDVVGQNGN